MGTLLLDASDYFFYADRELDAESFSRADANLTRLSDACNGRQLCAFFHETAAGTLRGALLADLLWEAGAHVYAVPDVRGALLYEAKKDEDACVLSKHAGELAGALPENRLYHTWTVGRDGGMRLVRSDTRLCRPSTFEPASRARPKPLPAWCDVRADYAARALASAETPFELAVVDAVAANTDLLRAARDVAKGAKKTASAPGGNRRPFTVCRGCACAFIIMPAERAWFEAKDLELPARCKPCRAERRK